MHITDIAHEIELKIKEIEMIKGVIKQRGLDKSKAISEYRKALAKVMIQLKNGIEFDLDGVKITNPGATNTLAIAHGICWKEKLAEQETEALYKSAITNLEATSVQLVAYQSLFRHLDKGVN
jgi:hypothetical protein